MIQQSNEKVVPQIVFLELHTAPIKSNNFNKYILHINNMILLYMDYENIQEKTKTIQNNNNSQIQQQNNNNKKELHKAVYFLFLGLQLLLLQS